MGTAKAASEKLTRKEAKALTRRKLIDALLDISREEGIAALSTTCIARRAGVAQSVFYDHFADMDDAMTVAANQVGHVVRAAMAEGRAKIDLVSPDSAIRSIYAAAIDGLLAEPMLTELLLRHRRDASSSLGSAFRRILDEVRGELLGDVERLGLVQALPAPALYVDLFISMTLSVVERAIDGGPGSPEEHSIALDVLTHITTSALALAPR